MNIALLSCSNFTNCNTLLPYFAYIVSMYQSNNLY